MLYTTEKVNGWHGTQPPSSARSYLKVGTRGSPTGTEGAYMFQHVTSSVPVIIWAKEHMLIIYYFIYVYIVHNIYTYVYIIYIYILASQLKWDDWTSWQRVTATSNPWRCKDKRKCCMSGPEIVMSKSKGQQLRVQNKVHIYPYSTTEYRRMYQCVYDCLHHHSRYSLMLKVCCKNLIGRWKK